MKSEVKWSVQCVRESCIVGDYRARESPAIAADGE